MPLLMHLPVALPTSRQTFAMVLRVTYAVLYALLGHARRAVGDLGRPFSILLLRPGARQAAGILLELGSGLWRAARRCTTAVHHHSGRCENPSMPSTRACWSCVAGAPEDRDVDRGVGPQSTRSRVFRIHPGIPNKRGGALTSRWWWARVPVKRCGSRCSLNSFSSAPRRLDLRDRGLRSTSRSRLAARCRLHLSCSYFRTGSASEQVARPVELPNSDGPPSRLERVPIQHVDLAPAARCLRGASGTSARRSLRGNERPPPTRFSPRKHSRRPMRPNHSMSASSRAPPTTRAFDDDGPGYTMSLRASARWRGDPHGTRCRIQYIARDQFHVDSLEPAPMGEVERQLAMSSGLTHPLTARQSSRLLSRVGPSTEARRSCWPVCHDQGLPSRAIARCSLPFIRTLVRAPTSCRSTPHIDEAQHFGAWAARSLRARSRDFRRWSSSCGVRSCVCKSDHSHAAAQNGRHRETVESSSVGMCRT